MRSTAILSAQLIVNALTGYAFQKLFAYHYGASLEKSIFDIAFSVPTMLIYMSGFGLTHSIVVSLFTRLRSTQGPELDRVFSSLLNASLCLLLVLILLTGVFSRSVAELLAPGLPVEQQIATQQLILWMLPLAVAFGASSYFSAVAVAWRVPVGQEALLLIARIAVIIWVMAHGHALPLNQIAAVLVGTSVIAVLAQWWLLVQITHLRYRPVLDLKYAPVRNAIYQFGGFLIVALAAQAANAYGKRVATLAGPDVVALLGFATSVIDPLGAITGKVLAFRLGQPLAAQMVTHTEGVLASCRRLVLQVLVAGVLLAAATAGFAEWLIGLLFGGGRFQESAIAQTAEYLQVMAIGLPAAIILWVVLYPLLGAGRHVAATVYVAGHVVQIAVIRALFEHAGGLAVAWGYTACLWIQAIAGWVMLQQKLSAESRLIR